MAYQKQTWVNDVTDVDATHMNHIEDGIEKAYGVKLLAVTDEEPSECSVGDKYFNTTTNKIYDAVDTDTWDDEGYDAESGVFYVVFEEQAIYTYNGTTLIGVGSSGAGGESLPLGVILAFGGSNAPEGYLLCNGQAVSRTQYSELFNIIGTTYGSGDGTTTFNVPNIKGKVLVGRDANDNDFYALGDTGGEKTHTLTINEIPSHYHFVVSSNPGTADPTDNSQLGFYATSQYSDLPYALRGTTQSANRGKSSSTGGGTSHNNIQPYIVVNFIIKATSTTPTTANVVNEESQSTTDAYSCDYVNSALSTKQDKEELSYCVATISSAQTISSNYVINLNSIARSNGNFTLGSKGIKIGTGINYIRVSGGLFVESWAGGGNYLWGQIKKNNSTISSCIVSGSSSYISSNIAGTIIPVQEGDIITILADAGAGGNLRTGAGNTWLCVEKVK